MNINRIAYWVSTGLMCALFLYSAGMYFTKYDMISAYFPQLGFPSWVVYPLAVAKVLGVIAVLSRKSRLLKEWAYAGFFFDAILAFGAHHYANDGQGTISMVAIILVVLSRIFESRYFD